MTRRRRSEGGQSLVEFSLIVSIMLVLVLGVVEMGMAIGNNMSLVVASREGARVGALLGNGEDLPTGSPDVDQLIVASVQRALESSGSGIDIATVDEIDIYKSTSTGDMDKVNVWLPSASGPTVSGVKLRFSQSSCAWPASARKASPPDSVGIRILYHYHLQTPLASIAGVFGTHQIQMTQTSVMAVEP